MIFSVALEGVINLSVEFKRRGCLSGREGVMKDAAVALRKMQDQAFLRICCLNKEEPHVNAGVDACRVHLRYKCYAYSVTTFLSPSA